MKKTFAALCLALLLCAGPALPAYAAETGSGPGASASDASQEASSSEAAASEEVGFYVHAVLPRNQREAGNSYFDLTMEPRQEQDLLVEVINTSKEDIVVKVAATSAATTRGGIIDYTTPTLHDETLAVPFADIATVQKPTLTVPAGGTATAVVRLEMPKDPFDGMVLGGIVITKPLKEDAPSSGSEDESAAQSEASTALRNTYTYVVAVALTETEAEVAPDFALDEVEPTLVNYAATPVHYIRNTQAAFVKDLALQMDIYHEDSAEPLVQVEQEALNMAPNSVMPFAPEMPESRLAPGSYCSLTVLTVGDKTWEFENTFTVEGAVASGLNEQVLAEETPGFPLWAAVLIAVLSLAVAGLIVAVVLMRRRQRMDPRTRYRRDDTLE